MTRIQAQQKTRQRQSSSLSSTSPATSAASSTDTVAPSHDAIAKRAYDIYLQSGCMAGRCERNWYLAEQSCLAQAQRSLRAAQSRFDDNAERMLSRSELDLGPVCTPTPMGRSGWAPTDDA